MSVESQTADQLMQLSVSGIIYAIQIGGALTKEIQAFLVRMQEKGESDLQRFFEEGEGVQAFNLNEDKLETFQKAADQIGMRYQVACLDMSSPEGKRILTIYVKPKDVPNVNMIIEQNNLMAVEAGAAEVSGSEEKISPETPFVPGTTQPEKKEELHPTWEDFINENEEYETPSHQAQRKAQEANATPTKPESQASVATPSETGFGQAKSAPFQTINNSAASQPAQGTSVAASHQSPTSVYTGNERRSFNELLTKSKRIMAEKTAREAKELGKTEQKEAAQKAASAAADAVLGG